MLDFTQLLPHIDAMANARYLRREDAARALSEAQLRLTQLAPDWESLATRLRIREWPWLIAVPREPLDFRGPAPLAPACYAVVASDGSQIAPDRHEVSSCYLLNISQIRLAYGDGERPRLACQPRLYYEEADLAVQEGGVRLPIEGKYLAIRRMLEETLQLVSLLKESVRPERPCLALADGTLIQWPISREAQGYSGQALAQFLDSLEDARLSGGLLAGYISDPGGSSVVATLRAASCPEGFMDGKHCSCVQAGRMPPRAAATNGGSSGATDTNEPNGHGTNGHAANGHTANGHEGNGHPARTHMASGQSAAVATAPPRCSVMGMVSDARLFSAFLSMGERSALFESTSQVLSRYGDHRICFFYVNVGREIARIEVPLWVADDPQRVDMVHAIVLDQALKGKGYPVALSEAHERAVVNAADRAMFYTLVERAFMRRGLPAELSLKAISKRQPLV